VASREATTTASVFIAIVICLGNFLNRHSLSLFRDRRSLSLFQEVTAIQKLSLTIKVMMWLTHSQCCS
jgi:hypothetical protein